MFPLDDGNEVFLLLLVRTLALFLSGLKHLVFLLERSDLAKQHLELYIVLCDRVLVLLQLSLESESEL